MAAVAAAKGESYFPVNSLKHDGYSTAEEATATCFCGAVQIAIPITAPGLIGGFMCNCADCHKITASMFSTVITVRSDHVKHIRGESNLTVFAQDKTPVTKKTIANHFCKTCGTLMYRKGNYYPGITFARLGTVDNFTLMEKVFRPDVEQFEKERVTWLKGMEGGNHFEAMPF